jgi:hypothetical protein
MNDYKELLGKNIEIEISGSTFITGVLIDEGLDIVVIYNGKTQQFFYIPSVHIQRLKEVKFEEDTSYTVPEETPLETDTQSISFRKMLMNAKGKFVQIYVAGNKSIHGYLTSIMNDYFIFYSPVYKTIIVSMKHVKWLIPYLDDAIPYSLNNYLLPVNPASFPLARTFEEQCKKLLNHIVVLDGGDQSEKIGLLKTVQNNKLILITAERELVYRNLEHIKMIHLP